MSLSKPYFPDYLGFQFDEGRDQEIADFIREAQSKKNSEKK